MQLTNYFAEVLTIKLQFKNHLILQLLNQKQASACGELREIDTRFLAV